MVSITELAAASEALHHLERGVAAAAVLYARDPADPAKLAGLLSAATHFGELFDRLLDVQRDHTTTVARGTSSTVDLRERAR